MNSSKYKNHIDSCEQKNIVPCPANKSLHGEKTDQHWWSGWPGAMCLKCGDDDKNELCLADNCKCPCHDDFWNGCEKACKKEQLDKLTELTEKIVGYKEFDK